MRQFKLKGMCSCDNGKMICVGSIVDECELRKQREASLKLRQERLGKTDQQAHPSTV